MELNYKTMGNGPALVILHGLFGSLDNWISHARALSAYFTVYIVDQRNHGKSPHASEWDYEVMADDLRDFMDQQGIMQAHLIGHSMGGKTVMQFAADYPERIIKLIVADMAPKTYQPHHTTILENLINMDLAEIGSRKEADQLMEAQIPEVGVRQFLLKSLGRDEHKNFAWKFNLPVIYHAYEEVLKNVYVDPPYEGPTLFLHGGKSNYLKVEDYDMIRTKFSAAQFEVIEQAGHWLHAEAPADFQQKVLSYLQ